MSTPWLTLDKQIACGLISSSDGGVPYITRCAMSQTGEFLAAVMSDGRVKIIDCDGFSEVASVRFSDESTPTNVIRDVAWCETLLASSTASAPSRQYHLIACTSHGNVDCFNMTTKSFDWRMQIPVTLPRGTPNDPSDWGLYSVAVNSAGEMLVVSDVEKIHFYDLRGVARHSSAAFSSSSSSGSSLPVLLDVYESSHSAAITQLCFHPVVPHCLLSGSDDGLLCAFDTSIKGEDDSLLTVCNAESAISRFGLFGPQASLVWLATRSGSLSVWNVATAERLMSFSSLSLQLLEAGVDFASIVSCHFDDATELLRVLISGARGTLSVLLIAGSSSICLGGALVGGHAAEIRDAAWLVCQQQRPSLSEGSGAGAATGGVICITASEDGTICRWFNEEAAPSIKTSGGFKGSKRDIASVLTKPHLYTRALKGSSTGLQSDAAAFGTRLISSRESSSNSSSSSSSSHPLSTSASFSSSSSISSSSSSSSSAPASSSTGAGGHSAGSSSNEAAFEENMQRILSHSPKGGGGGGVKTVSGKSGAFYSSLDASTARSKGHH